LFERAYQTSFFFRPPSFPNPFGTFFFSDRYEREKKNGSLRANFGKQSRGKLAHSEVEKNLPFRPLFRFKFFFVCLAFSLLIVLLRSHSLAPLRDILRGYPYIGKAPALKPNAEVKHYLNRVSIAPSEKVIVVDIE